ncbi:hypothetical protein [Flavobacterium noncentrifugens]|nr:hypothetical protein [Flavobacterium noncentrifugens]
MDSKEQFFKIISTYYSNITGDKIPKAFLTGMCVQITDYYYDQYTRSYMHNPKSKKRYSTFDLKDIDHPYTFEIAIKYFKKTDPNQYLHYAALALDMTESDIKDFEKSREDFYNMF